MDEPIKTFDLSPEQQNTTILIQRLLGKRIADRYVDFCRLAAGSFALRVSSPMAAHALRELESILRQTLEVPMDLVVTPSPEQTRRIEEVKKQLKAAGFSDDAVHRAANQLRPRLSHKEEIEKIVTRLGLAPDGDIARAWKSISQIHGQAHGARALHQSFAVDDDFRVNWQAPFDTAIRGLMIALQGNYAAFMRRIDQLVAVQDRGAAVTSFSKEIPGALPLLWHFFNKLETPDWLPHLAKRRLLVAPLSQADEAGDDGIYLRQWPAGRYLLRMAKSHDASTLTLVVAALRDIAASTHPDVQQMGMEILASLPPADAAPLVDLADQWLTPDARFIMAQAPHDLIKSLAQGNEGDAALQVTRSVFKVFEENEKLTTLFSRHMYEHHLPDAVKAIAPVCKIGAVCLISDLLNQAVYLSGKVKDDPPHDYTYYLSGNISEHGIKHDVIESLVGELVRSSKLLIEADPTCTRSVVLAIRKYSPKIFIRIGLHVLSLNPSGAPDLAQAWLTDRDLLEGTWCLTEYGALARAWFPSLPKSIQLEILACVDRAPDQYRGRFKELFEQREKRPPTPQEEQSRDETLVRDLLWHWREALPTERRESIERLGDPEAWRQRLYEAPKSPQETPELSTAPIDEIVAFLETWRPSSSEQRETITALAQDLRNAAMVRADLYSANAIRFAPLPPIYVRAILEGLSNASNNNNDLDWAGALELVEAVARPVYKHAPSSIEGDDPDWSWSQKAAIGLLASGLRRGAHAIPFVQADLVQQLVLELYRSAPRQPDTDNFEESYSSFPHFGAQATRRGAAVELAILLIFWRSKDEDNELGKRPREALQKLSNVRQLFEAELADRTSSGRIPRAIMGRYLNWLAFFGESWLRQHMPVLFPDNDIPLRDATWLAHLSADSGPMSGFASAMRACYVDEIKRLGQDNVARDKQHVDDRLAEYLVILYIKSAFPDDVFEQFWDSAPAGPRQHAIWFLGVQLELRPDQLPDDLRARARSYWERRLAAAKASQAPDRFRDEIGAIGQLFFRKGISDEWLMDQVLSMSHAGFAPSEPYSVLDRLALASSKFPDRAAETLTALVKNQRFDRRVYMSQSAGMRSIFTNGFATGSPATAAAVTEAINYLATLGDTGYLDLLPGP
ncbi:hypothetical protein [Tardiphaga robiniae]|uniref:Uncharacterized protein n=1 Tax=Tardiphaga robiniae TaxID=943830 RepID=A0A164B257_9BRAD|nr:hypothetical protein [Tardiphaga robiniae]KZD25650.1 hypothetical protein A4A58_04415 [Tardiphaga robiniae]